MGLFRKSQSTDFEFQLKTHPAQWLGAAVRCLEMFGDVWRWCPCGALAVDFVRGKLGTEPPLGLMCTAAESETIHPGKEFRAVNSDELMNISFLTNWPQGGTADVPLKMERQNAAAVGRRRSVWGLQRNVSRGLLITKSHSHYILHELHRTIQRTSHFR